MIYNLKDVYEELPHCIDFINKNGRIVYKITNTVNNKSYIGTTKLSIRYRFFECWQGSHFKLYEENPNIHLYRAMNKYGIDNFTLEVVRYCSSVQEMDDLEEEVITYYDSYHNGYNRTKDGKGSHHNTSVNKGRIRVTNGIVNRVIKPNDLAHYRLRGFRRGMTSGHLNDEEVLEVSRSELKLDSGLSIPIIKNLVPTQLPSSDDSLLLELDKTYELKFIHHRYPLLIIDDSLSPTESVIKSLRSNSYWNNYINEFISNVKYFTDYEVGWLVFPTNKIKLSIL